MNFFDIGFVLLRLFLLRNATDTDSGGNEIQSRRAYTPGDYLVADGYRWDSKNLGAIPFKDSDYFISVNPATWNNAEDDCIKVFKSKGKKGALVVIETEAERKNLNLMLERFGSGKKYWTSGIWEGKSWLWGNGEKIPGFLLPSSDSRPSIQDRLILDYNNRFSSQLDIRSDTEPHRYICEVEHDASEDDGCGDKPCPGPCGGKPCPGPCGGKPCPGPCGDKPCPGPCGDKPCPGPCGGKPCPGPCGDKPCPGPCGDKPCPCPGPGPCSNVTTTTTTVRPPPPPPPPNQCHYYSSSITQCMACPGCAYCGYPSYTGPRCDTKETIDRGCNKQYICDKFDSIAHTTTAIATINRNQYSNARDMSPWFFFCPGSTRFLTINYDLPGCPQIGIHTQQTADSQVSGVDRMGVWFFSNCNGGGQVETKICNGGRATFTMRMTMDKNGCQGLNSMKNMGLIIRPQFYPSQYDFTIPYTMIC